MLRVDGEPRKTAGPTLPGAAHRRRDQRALRVDGKPRQEPHTPGGTKRVLWVGCEPAKTAGPTLLSVCSIHPLALQA